MLYAIALMCAVDILGSPTNQELCQSWVDAASCDDILTMVRVHVTPDNPTLRNKLHALHKCAANAPTTTTTTTTTQLYTTTTTTLTTLTTTTKTETSTSKTTTTVTSLTSTVTTASGITATTRTTTTTSKTVTATTVTTTSLTTPTTTTTTILSCALCTATGVDVHAVNLGSWQLCNVAESKVSTKPFYENAFELALAGHNPWLLTGLDMWTIDANDLAQNANEGANIASVQKMFAGIPTPTGSVYNPSLNGIGLRGITDMSGMFEDLHTFDRTLPSWDVAGVTDFSNMFAVSNEITVPHRDFGIQNWDVGAGRTFKRMFYNSGLMTDISKWRLTEATDLTEMLAENTEAQFAYDLSDWCEALRCDANILGMLGAELTTTASQTCWWPCDDTEADQCRPNFEGCRHIVACKTRCSATVANTGTTNVSKETAGYIVLAVFGANVLASAIYLATSFYCHKKDPQNTPRQKPYNQKYLRRPRLH